MGAFQDLEDILADLVIEIDIMSDEVPSVHSLFL